MIKEYTLPGYSAAVLRFSYLGNTVNVEFKNAGCKAGTSRYITGNKFVQDAIEKDPRFGSGIILTARFAETPENEAKSRVRKVKKVASVKSINDAMRYLADHGVEMSDSINVFEEAEKLDVEFVNLTNGVY